MKKFEINVFRESLKDWNDTEKINTTILKRKTCIKINKIIKKKKIDKFLFTKKSLIYKISTLLNYFFIYYYIVYNLFLISFNLYEFNVYNITTEIIIEIFFILDFLIILNTNFEDYNALAITNRYKIFINYLNGYFIFDLLNFIPFLLILFVFKINLYYFKYFTFLRIFKIYYWFDKNKIELISLLFFNVLKNAKYKKIYYWATLLIINIQIFSCIKMFANNFNNNNFIISNNLLFESVHTKYITVLYWIFQTIFTVGYGDIINNNNIDRLIAIIVMIFGVIIYSIIISSVFSILNNNNNKFKIKEKYLQNLEKIKNKYKLNIILDNKIKKFIQKNDYINENYKDLFQDIPLYIEIEMKYIIYKNLNKINYFYFKNEKFISLIGDKLNYQYFNKNEIIFEKDNYAEEIFFIKTGSINVLDNDNKSLYLIEEGNYFGEWDIFFNNSIRKYSVKSETRCVFYWLKKQHFYDLYFKQFIQYKQEMVSNSFVRFNKFEELWKLNKDKMDSLKIKYVSKYYQNKNLKFYNKAKKSLKSNNKLRKLKLNINFVNNKLDRLNYILEEIIKIDKIKKKNLK